jgi:hypothetical protein
MEDKRTYIGIQVLTESGKTPIQLACQTLTYGQETWQRVWECLCKNNFQGLLHQRLSISLSTVLEIVKVLTLART